MSAARDQSRAVRSARRALGEALAPLGFAPAKATFFTRVHGDVVEFIHVHKFSGALEFRVHCGARAVDDPTPHPVLNGPDSDSVVSYFPNPLCPRRRYRFTCDGSPGSIGRCVDSMADFCRRTAESWFRQRREQHPPAGRRLSPQTADVFGLIEEGAAPPTSVAEP